METLFQVCKFFLEAVEKGLYGWFWSCPNGPKCIYRHALPPGFVLKKKQTEKEVKEEISFEEFIETEVWCSISFTLWIVFELIFQLIVSITKILDCDWLSTCILLSY